MVHNVHCLKLQKSAPGLESPPIPGPLGEKIYQHISEEAWQQWLAHQTKLINEYRLNLLDEKSKAFLLRAMEDFLFHNKMDNPPDYQEKK